MHFAYMDVELKNVDEVVNKTVKNGRITGLTDWEGKTVKILIMSVD